MPEVEVKEDQLIARIQGLDQVLALKSELTIPLAHVKSSCRERDPDRTVVIELDHERFANLVLEVKDPQATAAPINAALAGRI